MPIQIPWAPRQIYHVGPYQPNTQIPELIMARGQNEAQGALASGALWARTLGDIGAGIGQAIRQRPLDEEAIATSKARRAELEEQTAGRKQSREALQRRQQAVSGGGTRQQILSRLEGDPEGYATATKHFEEIDNNLKRTLGSWASAVRSSGDSPEYAQAALQDMVENGFDPKHLAPYAARMRTKEGVTAVIDTLLKGSPDEGHRALVTPKPELMNVPPGDAVINKLNPGGGALFTAPVVEKPGTGFNLGPGETRFDASGKPIASLPPKPDAESKARIWVMRPGPDGKLAPMRVSESEVRPGDQPANTREQGRPVVAGQSEDLADFDTALDDLSVVRKRLAAPGSTGVAASIGAAMPAAATDLFGWGADAKARQATIDRVKQVIGKTLEGGVLRKEDELKYEKILPTIKDTATVVKAKLDGLEAAITKRKQRRLDSLEDSGYDVSRYRNRQPKTEEKKLTWGVEPEK